MPYLSLDVDEMSSVRFAPKGEEKPEPQWEHLVKATPQPGMDRRTTGLRPHHAEYENLKRRVLKLHISKCGRADARNENISWQTNDL